MTWASERQAQEAKAKKFDIRGFVQKFSTHMRGGEQTDG
jgi:hypothetical protein